MRAGGRIEACLFFALVAAAPLVAADWPMWRHDAGRSGQSPQVLADELHLLWTSEQRAMVPAFNQVRQQRLQFDRGHEPIVAGKTLLIGSSANDSLVALDTETGARRWQFFADGPIRLAPAAADGRAYVGSDDGCLYCLELKTGDVIWKRRVAPSSRKVLGNGRMISVWPVRGGPVVQDGVVYAAAGVWPFEGIFVAAFDARDGSVRWYNDRTGSLYLVHPHNAEAFGGPSPQGYLLLHQGKLVAPSGRAFPAFYDLASGKLHDFDFGYAGFGSRPGSWFVMTGDDGRLHVDPEVNVDTHDAGDQVIGQTGIRQIIGETMNTEITIGKMTYEIRAGISRSIRAGGREYRFDEPPPGVEGKVHSMVAADGKLFVVTREGILHAFGPAGRPAVRHALETTPPPTTEDGRTHEIARALKRAGPGPGYAVVWGSDERLVLELVRQSRFNVIAIEADSVRADAFRRRMDAAGLYGSRVALLCAAPADAELPPYCARLLIGDHPAGDTAGILDCAMGMLRPYGGVACIRIAGGIHDQWARAVRERKISGVGIERHGDLTWIERQGPLPGAKDYAGQQNFDAAVKAPLGILWFGDTHHHHKLFYRGYTLEGGRGLPGTITINHGVIHYLVPKQPLGPNPKDLSYAEYLAFIRDRMEHEDAYTDVFTGLALSESEARGMGFLRNERSAADAEAHFAIPSVRRNPITGLEEARQFAKTHGCDGFAIDYGNLYTMRSGTAAFYDPGIESGTVNISGMRSGCRNNMVPADGLLNIPHWTGNCTCNYPVSTSLALLHVPEEREQWSAWGPPASGAPVRRLGINFGAPGDRMTSAGTLWLEYPSVGGPSPEVKVEILATGAEFFYRHALWMKRGESWPWVAASGVKGMRSIDIEPAVRKAPSDGSFSVRWVGWVEVPSGGEYRFHLKSDSRARLKIDTAVLVDTGRSARRDEDGTHFASWKAEAGRRYAVQVEYSRRGDAVGDAFCELSWTPPQGAKVPVAAECLYTAKGEPGGLTGIYYDSAELSGPAFLRTDRAIACHWGRRLPEPIESGDAPITLEPRPFVVRLHFGEPEPLEPGQRVFDVRLQGRRALEGFDIVREAQSADRGVVKEFRDVLIGESLRVEFEPRSPLPPLISGIELIAQ